MPDIIAELLNSDEPSASRDHSGGMNGAPETGRMNRSDADCGEAAPPRLTDRAKPRMLDARRKPDTHVTKGTTWSELSSY